MASTGHITKARERFHAELVKAVLQSDKGIASNADSSNRTSKDIANGILQRLGSGSQGNRLAGQSSGNQFEGICAEFLKETFLKLDHLRPGKWEIRQVTGRDRLEIAKFEQYQHLIALDRAAKHDPELAAALGSDYTITPDIIVSREPEEDEAINNGGRLVDLVNSRYSSLRKRFNPSPILHASISCKWTIRSDRAQNSRTEGMNLVRNRKGRLPHVVVVVGEPLPSRIASIALGTGDIDCVYHFALNELAATVKELNNDEARELLDTMIKGKRLKDISDLPLDLVV